MRHLKLLLILLIALSSALPASAADFKPNGLIVLLTDFGTRDFYVGAMKGAILRTSPNVRIEDISHEVPKYDIAEGAYTLLKSAPEFPKGTVFLCVVDPGVGTARKPVAVLTSDGNVFVGPDNGLFTRVIETAGLTSAYELTNADLMGKDLISSTFHGRDVFGPVAAHLASGFPIDKVGPRLETVIRLESRKPRVERETVIGEVTLVDEYGDVLTNILRKDLEQAGIQKGDTLKIRIGDREVVAPFLKTYGDVPEGKPVCMISSGEVFETAINQGDLGRSTGARRGDPVTVL
jgi:S-adenosylmethionine hydrolase